MFEHMMFKGNEHLTPETFDNLTENIGGENNAYTADDVTVYHEVVPSNYLNPILWAEAERMSGITLNDQNFASERDVVKEEYRQRILANPYGEFYLDIDRKSFTAIPTNARASAASRTSKHRSFPKFAPSTRPSIGRTTRRSSSWAISSRRSSTDG